MGQKRARERAWGCFQRVGLILTSGVLPGPGIHARPPDDRTQLSLTRHSVECIRSGSKRYSGYSFPTVKHGARAVEPLGIRRISALLLSITLLATLATAAKSSAEVRITNLGSLPGGTGGRAYGINNASQVVGYGDISSGELHAFLWQDGAIKDLGTLPGGTTSEASDINERAHVVGASAGRAFLWQDGVMTNLGVLPGDSQSAASGINDADEVVGLSTSTSGDHAFRWRAGVMTDLGTLGGQFTEANGINDAGQVVGDSFPVSGYYHAFLWQNGTMTNLGTLPRGWYSFAYGINDAGQVVGFSSTSPDGVPHAFLWQSGAMTDLGTLPGGSYSYAYGINDAGEIVGSSEDASGSLHAFLWQNGTMTDLGTFQGDPYSEAVDINDAGQIVGYSYSSGTGHAVIWTVGPGPLMASALAAPSATDVGLPMSFTCATIGGAPPYAVSWDFGDGQSGAGSPTTHAYASPGPKTATCTVTDTAGVSTASSTSVQVYLALTGTASVDRTATSPGRLLTFTATAAGGSGAYTYIWTLGDGSSGTGSPLTHAYASPNTYLASVMITDSVGGTASSSVTVAVAAYLAIAMATSSATSAASGDTIRFAATATGGDGGYSFTWDFGDGTRATGPTVTHEYANPGSYTPVVTVMDAVGVTNRTQLATITIRTSAAGSAIGLDPIVVEALSALAVAAATGAAVYIAGKRSGKR